MTTKTVFKLRNGEEITVRPIALDDSDERHEFFIALSLGQIGVLHTVDEIDFHNDVTRDQIKDFLRHKRGLWLIALNALGKIIGELDITVKNLTRIRHNGQCTIGILAEYQGLGLGKFMMEQAFGWALEQNLLRLEISVFEGNIRALRFYNKLGFVVEGRRKDYVKLGCGKFEDDLLMARYFP